MAKVTVFETNSLLKQSVTSQNDQLELRLPKIDKPHSRDNLNRAEKRKSPPFLPNIKYSLTGTPSQPADIRQQPHPKPQIDPQRDEFSLDIQQRLRLVLQNVNQGEQITEDEENGEEVDFEDLIQQNKEKLKQKQKLSKPHNNLLQKEQKKDVKAKSKTIKTKNQNSLYERRMKEYRDISLENKFIQKKKQIIAQKQEIADRNAENHKLKLKEEVPNKETKLSNKELAQDIHKYKTEFKNQANQPSKTADLFDNIHSLLENPHKLRVAGEIRKMNSGSILLLQQKIKRINEKLGVSEAEQIVKLGGKTIEQKTVLDWKRLEYNKGSNFRCCYDSNFEKEVDKIGSYQQKNSDYLSKLIEQQKKLVDFNLLDRKKKSFGKLPQ